MSDRINKEEEAQKRGADNDSLAEEAVQALALNPHPHALALVENLARKSPAG